MLEKDVGTGRRSERLMTLRREQKDNSSGVVDDEVTDAVKGEG